MKDESEDLNLHVQICTQRYNALEDKLEATNAKITSLEARVNHLSQTLTGNFLEIKLALQEANSRRDVQVIATLGTVAAAVIAVIGYIITH